MPSPFDALDFAMQAIIDQTFGGGIRIIPQGGDKNYSRGPDNARPTREGVRGTFAPGSGTAVTDYTNSNRNGAPVSNSASELWLDREAYTALGYQVVRNDLIEVEGHGRFVVAHVEVGVNGDATIKLNG